MLHHVVIVIGLLMIMCQSTAKPIQRVRDWAQNTSCCMNGGTCYFGGYCVCPDNFDGKYCQYSKEANTCGPLTHKVVVRLNCRACQCIKGVINCLQPDKKNCDEPPHPWLSALRPFLISEEVNEVTKPRILNVLITKELLIELHDDEVTNRSTDIISASSGLHINLMIVASPVYLQLVRVLLSAIMVDV